MADVGALGIRVERPSEFESALDTALSAGRPAILDVRTDLEIVAPPAWVGETGLRPDPMTTDRCGVQISEASDDAY